MSVALALTPLSDRYTAAATLTCPGTARLNITVDNGAAYYQLGEGWPTPMWAMDEIPILPGNAALDRRCDAIRLRSIKPPGAVPVVASVAAFTAEDLGDG